MWCIVGENLRAALHVHGADLGLHPAHGLQGGVVIADLHAAAHEVLPLKDDHAAALVGLKRTHTHIHTHPGRVLLSKVCQASVRWTGVGGGVTHSTVDGAQGHEALHMVGDGPAVRVPVGVLASLQDELLALEVMVLEAHPASQTETRKVTLCIHV